MYSTDPLFSAVAVSMHRFEEPHADHLREALRVRRNRRRRMWRRERAPRATVIKPVAVSACPESSHCLVWLS